MQRWSIFGFALDTDFRTYPQRVAQTSVRTVPLPVQSISACRKACPTNASGRSHSR